ncbi:DUF418 domain-containing protein [Aegicerativicinus sediminis]
MLSTVQSKFQPVQAANRINSLDVIRGIALLGILLMNIAGMGLPFAYSDPTVYGGADGWNLKSWIMTNMFFEGTMRGMFSMLFGAGVILLTSRLEKNGAGINTADIYYRRIIWLFIFGLIHVYLLLWDGEILYPYALCGLFLFPLRNIVPKNLIIGGLVILFLGTLWNFSDYQNMKTQKVEGLEAAALKKQGDSLNPEQTAAFEKWEKITNKKSEEELQEEIEARHEGYWSNVLHKVKENQFMQTYVMYRYFFYDIIAFMILGMAFFKLRIFHAEKSNKFYLIMMGIGYVIGLSINYYETSALISSNFDPMVSAKTSLTYDIGRLTMTMGHIGLIMLFVKSGILKFLQKSLAAVGRMALTNYLMHSIITGIIFLGFGFSMFGKLERHELYYIVFAIWIAQLIYSPIWLKYFKYGPFEWLWRSLTYGKKQQFKISSTKETGVD